MSYWVKTLLFALDFEETESWNLLIKCFNASVMAHVITPKANNADFVPLLYTYIIYYLMQSGKFKYMCDC